MSERYMLLEADVLDALKLIPSESTDAALLDPPYGLGTREPTVEEIIAYLTGAQLKMGGDFMNKKWDLPSVEVWKELYRVLRPGAHALIFGGTRTFDLLTIGLRVAGFEVRNCISWIYGSGMPKSLNVSIAIDDKLGAKRPVIGTRVLTGNAAMSTKEKGGTYGVQVGTAPAKTVDVTGPATPQAEQFDGYGTDLKPCWEPCLVVRKPIDSTIANTAMVYGTGGLNIDGCRLDFVSNDDESKTKTKNVDSRPRSEGGNYDAEGRWPPNVMLTHSAACTGLPNGDTACVVGCPIAELDAQSGNRPGMNGGGVHREGYAGGMFGGINSSTTARADFGGASRFMYCSKASRAEREFGCEHLPARSGAEAVDREEDSAGLKNGRAGASRSSSKVSNFHPTLKPIALARWLATLLLPPVLDRPRRILVPFSGSGSEMIGAIRAGWDEVVGIQRTTSEDEAQYVNIARARIERWSHVPVEMSEVEAVGEARVEKKKIDPRQVSMFDTPPRLTPLTPPPTPVVPSPVAVVSPPVAVVNTPSATSFHPTIGVREEMPMSELAKKLAEKGYLYTLAEIASWDTDKRLRAAKYARGET